MDENFYTDNFDALITHFCERGVLKSEEANQLIKEFHVDSKIDLSFLEESTEKEVRDYRKENYNRWPKKLFYSEL